MLSHEEIKARILAIHPVFGPDAGPPPIEGTGFVISIHGDVLTCAHVVRRKDSEGRIEHARLAYASAPGAREPVRFRIAYRHPADDVALLTPERPAAGPGWPAFCLSRQPAEGRDFISFGHRPPDDLAGLWTEGHVLGATDLAGSGRVWHLRSGGIRGGISGAPVYVQGLGVVGMIRSELTEEILGSVGDVPAFLDGHPGEGLAVTAEALLAHVELARHELTPVEGGQQPRAVLWLDDARDRGADLRLYEMVLIGAGGQGEAFYVDRYPVTHHKFRRHLGDRRSREECPASLPAHERGELPKTGISWEEAQRYARAVGKELPTTGQWRAAAERSPWGEGRSNSLDGFWRKHGGVPGLLPVTRFEGEPGEASPLDMIGNATELASGSGGGRVHCGWHFNEEILGRAPGQVTSRTRSFLAPAGWIGFRTVASLAAYETAVARCRIFLPPDRGVTVPKSSGEL